MEIVRWCSDGCEGHYSWYGELYGYKCGGTGVGPQRVAGAGGAAVIVTIGLVLLMGAVGWLIAG